MTLVSWYALVKSQLRSGSPAVSSPENLQNLNTKIAILKLSSQHSTQRFIACCYKLHCTGRWKYKRSHAFHSWPYSGKWCIEIQMRSYDSTWRDYDLTSAGHWLLIAMQQNNFKQPKSYHDQTLLSEQQLLFPGLDQPNQRRTLPHYGRTVMLARADRHIKHYTSTLLIQPANVHSSAHVVASGAPEIQLCTRTSWLTLQPSVHITSERRKLTFSVQHDSASSVNAECAPYKQAEGGQIQGFTRQRSNRTRHVIDRNHWL